jgi:1,2-diacylglycerol 3-alpha-glucosyltransferase
MSPLKIFFSCSGVGIVDRGIETFFREAFDGLRGTEGLDITLYKGAGEGRSNERVLWNVPRTGAVASFLGACIRRNSYVAEQLSTFPSMVRAIRKHQPDIIFYSDSNLGFQLFRWRKQIGVPFRLLFSNGGPVNPPFPRADYVHQVAPIYYEQALAAGVSPDQQTMVPYGILVPEGPPEVGETVKREVRRKLGLPLDRKIVLSVGWISAQQKRMDYLVNEVSSLPAPGPYLVLLGSMDKQSEAILDLARAKLGAENFMARSVSHQQVANYYRAADLFALASLQEGFGRVFLEALTYGLPVIAHNHPVMRFVLGDCCMLADLSKPGELAEKLAAALQTNNSPDDAAQRRESVRNRFSWSVLAPHYREMFYDCAQRVQIQTK